MKLIYLYLFFLILSCTDGQSDKKKSLCDTCPDDNSGQYLIETINSFIQNEKKDRVKINSILKDNFLECSKKKTSNDAVWFYISKDETRNYYHLIGQGDYSTELWVVAVNTNNEITLCFLGAASVGDGGDGFEISSYLKENLLTRKTIYTSIYMDSIRNEFTDSLRTVSIYSKYLIKKNELMILTTDTISRVSKWENN